MRAGMLVEALAQTYRVSLLVVPIFDNRTPTSDAFIDQCCNDVHVVQPQDRRNMLGRFRERFDGRPSLLRHFSHQTEACALAIGDAHFDVIHAFRLYTSPIAIALASKAPNAQRTRLHIDLDDIESATHRSLAELYRLNGRDGEADLEAREAQRYLRAEARLIRSFDRVYVCSRSDADRIAPLAHGEVRTVPNTVRPPATPATRLTSHPFTFLFVGTLGYYPNEDAVRYFCAEVLPLIRAQSSVPLRVRIVGRGIPEGLAPFAGIDEVRLAGEVRDLSVEYAEADAVIVPLRAGGGTRIKVLEAFAYHRPVVSTSIGIEGIEADPSRDYLLANTPATFASRCLSLMREPEIRETLAHNAAALVEERYSQESVNRLVASWS